VLVDARRLVLTACREVGRSSQMIRRAGICPCLQPHTLDLQVQVLDVRGVTRQFCQPSGLPDNVVAQPCSECALLVIQVKARLGLDRRMRHREFGEASGLALQQAFVDLAALREIGEMERLLPLHGLAADS